MIYDFTLPLLKDIPLKMYSAVYYFAIVIYFMLCILCFKEARVNYGSFRELMWNLVFKAEFDEMQKARWAEYIDIFDHLCSIVFIFLRISESLDATDKTRDYSRLRKLLCKMFHF